MLTAGPSDKAAELRLHVGAVLNQGELACAPASYNSVLIFFFCLTQI